MTIRIPATFEGRLLRSYLTHTMALSSGTLARLKANPRGITINGQHVTVRYVLHAGDLLELDIDDTPATATTTVLPAEGMLDILYEDDDLTVLNKPAGMPTHPSHGHLTDTLANALAYRYAQAGVPFVFRPLGRLDRNTSGVVVVSKTQAVSGFLGRAMCRKALSKRYLAVVEGTLPVDGQTHTIEVPILRPAVGVAMRTTCAPDTPGGEYALTHYRVLATSPTCSLVLVRPVTGRTHQIRVHFSHVGHPLLGDDIYGHPTAPAPVPMERHALHALSLSLPLPFAHAVEAPDVSPLATKDLPADTRLNAPSPDGYLHTWAPLPQDMRTLILRAFDAEHDAALSILTPPEGVVPTLEHLRRLTRDPALRVLPEPDFTPKDHERNINEEKKKAPDV